MESHSRWLVRVGAGLVALHPFAPLVLAAAHTHGFPVPEGWVPLYESSAEQEWSIRFFPFRSLLLLLILAAPVLSTFPTFREHRLVRRCQIGLVFLMILILVLAWSGIPSESSIPGTLRWGLPLLAGFWLLGMLLLGFDASSVGWVARVLNGALIFLGTLFFWAAGPLWAAFFMGLPICLLGAALMTTGELIYRSPGGPQAARGDSGR
jgi:hypothetical protein